MTQTTREKRALLQRAIDEGLEVGRRVEGNLRPLPMPFQKINGKPVYLGKTHFAVERKDGTIHSHSIIDYEFNIAEPTVTADMLAEAIYIHVSPICTNDHEDMEHKDKLLTLAAQYRKQQEGR